MSCGLLMIFMIDSSVTLWDFPSRFFKCCFHQCIRSSRQAAFNLALAVPLLLLTSFTVCHDILDCLSSIESLILLIWSWMYSVCSFRYMLVCSLMFFSVGVIWVSFISRFVWTANVSQGTLCCVLSLVGMHSAATSI